MLKSSESATKGLSFWALAGAYLTRFAPVAQLDRASDYESEGREFESLRARSHLMNVDYQILASLMQEALRESAKALQMGEVPVGAVVAHQGQILARGHNLTETRHDAAAHAEMIVLNEASRKLNNWRLSDCILCVTLEPCTMCIGASRLARVGAIVFGASDSRLGAAGSLYDLSEDPRLGPLPRVIRGVLAEECENNLKTFFSRIREDPEP